MRNLSFTKDTGPKPTKEHLKAAEALARPQSDDCLVIAMALRPNGVTQTEVVALVGHPHRNKIKKLVQDNLVKQVVLPDSGRSTRIRLVKR